MFPLASAAAKNRAAGAARPVGADDAAVLVARAPGLKDAAERILVTLVKSLQTMAGTSTTIEGVVAGFDLTTLRELGASQRPGAVCCAIECAGLPCVLLATLDAAILHTLIELLCGGSGVECVADDMRSATSIDSQYAQVVLRLVAGTIATELSAQGFGTTKAIKIEGRPADDCLGPKVEELVVARFAISLFGVRGVLTLAFPPVAIDAFSQANADIARPTAPADTDWRSSLKREVGQAGVRVDVLLAAQPLSLGAIAKLEIGQMLVLPADARSQASLVCNGRTLYRGEIGQHENNYSLRIDEAVVVTSHLPVLGKPPGKSLFKTMLKA